jgi:hypothetical protein
MGSDGVKLTMPGGASLELTRDDVQALLRLLAADDHSAPDGAVELRIRLLGSCLLASDVSLDLTPAEEAALFWASGRCAPLDDLAST